VLHHTGSGAERNLKVTDWFVLAGHIPNGTIPAAETVAKHIAPGKEVKALFAGGLTHRVAECLRGAIIPGKYLSA
jgi:hypothetical protein